MRNFVRASIKGVRRAALNQFCNFDSSDEVFDSFSQKLGVGGKISDFLGTIFDYVQKYEIYFEDEYDSHFEDYRDIDQREKNIY